MADLTDVLNAITGIAGAAGAYNTATDTAAANAAAIQQAAQMAQFKPVGLTSRFGSAGYTYDPTTGAVSGMGYMLAPDVAAQREAMMGLAGNQLLPVQAAQDWQTQGLTGAKGLFDLGQQYVAETPQTAAQNWMAGQQALLAPAREQEQAQLLNKLNRMGTSGLATGATQAGGMAATNPLMAEYQNRKMKEDLQLASLAQQAGQQQAIYGQNMMSGATNLAGNVYGLQQSALNPYIAYMNQAATLEGLGASPLTTSANIGAQALGGQGNAANLYAGGQTAANTATSSAYNDALRALTGAFSGLLTK